MNWFSACPVLRRSLVRLLLFCMISLAVCSPVNPAIAGINDDRFDGNIFALYAGNGSLVPPRISLAQSLSGARPTILTFYVEDSSDCKRFATVISQLQAYYGRAVDFIPINIDAISPLATDNPTEPGFYYAGKVPQTLIFDASGQIALNTVGNTSFETFDDTFRTLFDLLPRSESVELKRRTLNEINEEIVQK